MQKLGKYGDNVTQQMNRIQNEELYFCSLLQTAKDINASIDQELALQSEISNHFEEMSLTFQKFEESVKSRK